MAPPTQRERGGAGDVEPPRPIRVSAKGRARAVAFGAGLSRQGHHLGGRLLLLLCWSILPSCADGVGCGKQDSRAPTSIAQEFAVLGEFPWVVSLQDRQGRHVAFGSILSKHWILSVASSFQNRSQISALVGVTSPQQRHKPLLISTTIQHQAFDELTLVHDLALLKTAAPLSFSQAVQPICFPFPNLPAAALENCLLVGWLNPHAGSDSLRKLSVVDVDPCPLHRIVTTECASHRDGDNVPGCLGDPGNPVACQAPGTGQWVLKGVLSKGGARCYGPFLYTRVSSYSEWIVATTAKQGTPVPPTFVEKHFASWIPAGENRGVAEPLRRARVLNSSDSGEEPPGQLQAEEALEGSSSGQPVEPQGKALLPVYYDYYSGEVMPISTAKRGQPQGPRGVLCASSLLHLLTFWAIS
ncbi:inactive serine protease 54 [Hemicordylus capensis]|uniref:inactive serine protease 54 n=1 Tax=Hemicordylus capensis TaxID=884348 RepID=UPI0023038713|nr:inactive serine protease 54 [Hemicordylus capensis]